MDFNTLSQIYISLESEVNALIDKKKELTEKHKTLNNEYKDNDIKLVAAGKADSDKNTKAVFSIKIYSNNQIRIYYNKNIILTLTHYMEKYSNILLSGEMDVEFNLQQFNTINENIMKEYASTDKNFTLKMLALSILDDLTRYTYHTSVNRHDERKSNHIINIKMTKEFLSSLKPEEPAIPDVNVKTIIINDAKNSNSVVAVLAVGFLWVMSKIIGSRSK